MTTEQNPMQDCVSAVVDAFENLRRKMRGDTTGQELAAFAKLSTAVAALRAAGEPIGYVSAITLDTLRDNPGEGHGFVVGVPAYDTVIPLYAAQPAPSAIVREALEPFANMADHISDKSRDNRPIIYGVENIHAIQITVGDVRRAARALAALSSTPSPLMASGEAAPQASVESAQPPSWIDAAALQAAHEIVALPENWPYVRRKAAIQVIVAREMMRARIDAAARASETVDDLEDLVSRFSKALLAKLKLSRANGRSGWAQDNWGKQCQEGLLRHVAKGDPRDVAAYCAFAWHHGWPTAASETVEATSPAKRDYAARVMGDALPCHKCAGWGFVQTTSGVFRTDTCPVCDGATVAAEPTREEVVEEISRYFGKYPHICEKLADSVLDMFIKPRGEPAREGGK